MKHDKPKVVFRTTDPQRARLVTEFLNDHGIQARHFGTRHHQIRVATCHFAKMPSLLRTCIAGHPENHSQTGEPRPQLREHAEESGPVVREVDDRCCTI